MRFFLLLLSLNSSIAFSAALNCRYRLGGDFDNSQSFKQSGSPVVSVDEESILLDLTTTGLSGLSTTGSPEDRSGQGICDGTLELIMPFAERSRLISVELPSSTSQVFGEDAESSVRVKGESQVGNRRDEFEKVWNFKEEQNVELQDLAQSENTTVCGKTITLRLKLVHGKVSRGEDNSESARLSVPFVKLRFGKAPQGDRACINN